MYSQLRAEQLNPIDRIAPGGGSASRLAVLVAFVLLVGASCSEPNPGFVDNRQLIDPTFAADGGLSDSSAGPVCGNGELEGDELCDPGIQAGEVGACPETCPPEGRDDDVCRSRTIAGADCTRRCVYDDISACQAGDGCCPAGCDTRSDRDCAARCNNGVFEAPAETCDTAIAAGEGACPTSATCTTDVVCREAVIVGQNCRQECREVAIDACRTGDGCCPAGCNQATDHDCEPECGNGVREPDEHCDTAAAGVLRCSAVCVSASVCVDVTVDTDRCRCVTAAKGCQNDDGCCAAGCTEEEDNDCENCGNGVLDAGEACDYGISAGLEGACKTSAVECNDDNPRTDDILEGSAQNCSAECANPEITECRHGDEWCPEGCNNNNDNDCAVACGNGAHEEGELCDTGIAPVAVGGCPVDCVSSEVCKKGVVQFVDADDACSAFCGEVDRECITGDGCCHDDGRCSPAEDRDCVGCGNGRVEPEEGELCDTGIASAALGGCPVDCSSSEVCKRGVVQFVDANDACSAFCGEVDRGCITGDGCCHEDGRCSPAEDRDCAAAELQFEQSDPLAGLPPTQSGLADNTGFSTALVVSDDAISLVTYRAHLPLLLACPFESRLVLRRRLTAYYLRYQDGEWRAPAAVGNAVANAAHAIAHLNSYGLSIALDADGRPLVGSMGPDLGSQCYSTPANVSRLQDSGDWRVALQAHSDFGGGPTNGKEIAGHWTSVRADSKGQWQIAYQDSRFDGFVPGVRSAANFRSSEAFKLRVARLKGNGLGSVEQETVGPDGAGWYAQLRYTSDDRPVVFHFDLHSSRLTLSVKRPNGRWNSRPFGAQLNTLGTEAARPSFARNDSGSLFAVAYPDPFAQGQLRYTESSNLTDWTAAIDIRPDASGPKARFPSLAFDHNGNPAVAYYRCSPEDGDDPVVRRQCHAEDDGLMFAHRVDGVWRTIEVDNGGSSYRCGMYPALSFDKDNLPVIAYQCEVRGGLIVTAGVKRLKFARGVWR